MDVKIWVLSLGIMGLTIYRLVRRYQLLVEQHRFLNAEQRYYGRAIRNWGGLPIVLLIYRYWSAPEDFEAKIGIPFAVVYSLFFFAVTVLMAELVATDRALRSTPPEA